MTGRPRSTIAGTSVIAYSSISDTAGGYFFRFADDGLSDITVGSSFSNFDRPGRELRVRYDTPLPRVRAAHVLRRGCARRHEQSAVRRCVTYGGELEQFDLDAAIAFARNEGTDTDILAGSISGLHKPSGLA